MRAVCGAAESREELVNEVFQVDEKYVRIDHIPARVCTRCGDETFSRETTEKVVCWSTDKRNRRNLLRLEIFEFA